MRTSSYSDFLASVSALIGVDQADLQATEVTFLNTFFNRALRNAWERVNWTDLSPVGEVRFPVNLIGYPNDLTQSPWTITNAAGTSSSLVNPLDNRVTASKLLETSPTGAHGFSQAISILPNTAYQASGYVRPNGRNFIQVTLNDGVTSFSSFYNLITGATGTTVGAGVTNGIQQQGNGYFYWSLSATSSVGAFSGMLSVNLSPDGVTASYAGSSTLGAYFWGTTMAAPSSQIPASNYIPWEQNGEASIDVLYEAWTSDPGSFLPPYRADYNLTTNGIELIGPTSTGPIYLSYRQRRPLFTGAAYSAGTAYSAGQSFYYTNTAGAGNYYTVNSATSAGQTPDTNPNLFSVIQFPYIFFEYVVNSAYADWLDTEGQSAKAMAQRANAQLFLDNELDRQERQQGNIQPWKVYTHLTSQNRGLGYVGQNFNAGTATIN